MTTTRNVNIDKTDLTNTQKQNLTKLKNKEIKII